MTSLWKALVPFLWVVKKKGIKSGGAQCNDGNVGNLSSDNGSESEIKDDAGREDGDNAGGKGEDDTDGEGEDNDDRKGGKTMLVKKLKMTMVGKVKMMLVEMVKYWIGN